ncbi:hypothetical protein, partial [Mycolicibacterium sp. P1-18]|uniref:hypothetical protein n=1 Tax=Mycolicibacterium sp. P1-18 TaxID=2024615 RepID=UPI001A932BF6
HAASVRPEPESNSPNKNNPTKVRCIANQRNPISNNQSKLAKKQNHPKQQEDGKSPTKMA